ncbi:hypothetical protein ACIPYR_35820 [Streptomyces parvus]|uniref:hypothetical protein n=1 Tax=Streptomyces parvus TaxID=66428 RepID=UPI003829E15F
MTLNQSPPARGAATTGSCPICRGNFETCGCTVGVAVLDRRAESVPAPAAAGGYGGWEDEDNRRGYEHDETDQLHQLVGRLVADGDRRAAAAGRRARRTLADMAPGQAPQPVLYMTRRLTFAPSAPASQTGGPCTSCDGQGGKTIDTSGDGVSRQSWQSCVPCGGTGVAR